LEQSLEKGAWKVAEVIIIIYYLSFVVGTCPLIITSYRSLLVAEVSLSFQEEVMCYSQGKTLERRRDW